MNKNKSVDIVFQTFQSWKIYLAIALGLCVSGFQFYKGLDGQSLKDVIHQIGNPNWSWLVTGFFVLLLRDLGYIFRIKHLTKNDLSWKSSFYTIILWEFASAITPSVVGGTPFAVFILNKEGIKMGRSIAIISLTAILDNSFFILAAPLGMLWAQDSAFFQEVRSLGNYNFTLSSVFFISYSLIAIYTVLMTFGVLINPKYFQKLIIGIVNLLRLSKKIKRKAYKLTIDNVTAAEEIKKLNFSYWWKASFSTLFIWIMRYFMLNCLLAAYFPMDVYAHQEAFGKQLVLWVTQLISPTPGASGVAEVFMRELFGATLIISAITLLWRFITYYSYLGLGAIFLPKWLANQAKKSSTNQV